MDVNSISDIRNRRDFHDAFQAAMSGAHETLRALWHFEEGQNLPKSYLIEFHPKQSCSQTHEWTMLPVMLKRRNLNRRRPHVGGIQRGSGSYR
jgi:hypothetical protein